MANGEKLRLAEPIATRLRHKVPGHPFEYGIRVHLEYEYLRNTDLAWLFSEVRASTKEELAKVTKLRKRSPITFEVAEIRTGQSITAIFLAGVITGVAGNAAYDVLKLAGRTLHRRLREKRVRRHFVSLGIQVIRVMPDGSFSIEEDFGEALEK